MKRFLRKAAASIVAGSMAVSSVPFAVLSSLQFTAVEAFAEATTVASWKAGDSSIPAAFGAEAALSAITVEQTIKTSATTTFSDNFVTVAGTTAKDAYECVSAAVPVGSTAGKKYCVFVPTATGNLNLYAINSGSKTTKAGSIRVYNGLTDNGDGTYTLPSSYDSYDVHGYLEGAAVAPVSIPVTKGTPVCVYFGNSKTALLGMTLVGEAGGDDTTTTTTTEATTNSETTTETTTTTTETSTETTTTAPVSSSWQIKADTAPSAGYESGDLVYEDEYAQVYAAQKIKVQSKALTVNGRTYEKGFATSGINTTIDGVTFRLAFKVVAKQATRVSADTSGGSKNSIFLYDETAGTYTNLTGLCGQQETMYADLEAGQVAYIGNGGTNNSMLAVDIKKGPSPVSVSTKITLGNSAAALPADAVVTVNGEKVTANEDGSITFSGKTSTSYVIAYSAGGVNYQATLSVGDDGTVDTVFNLPQVSGDATVTVKTAAGTAVVGKKVTLTYYDGYKPVYVSAVTDSDGVATFVSLGFEVYNVAIAGYVSTTETFAPVEGNIALAINDATAKAYPTISNSDTSALYVGYQAKDGYNTFDSVQDAVDAASEGQTIYLAKNVYVEPVYIDKSVNIIGTNDGTAADKATITYNDSQSGNDSSKGNGETDKVRFHGDTVTITATSATVNFENVKIANTSESDLGVTQNGTALSAYGTDHANTISLKDCDIIATRDTVYTGSRSSNGLYNTWTFDNCVIAGFQDVVCGCGDVTINDSTWNVNLDNDARFLVPNSTPNSVSKMVANNLTVKDDTATGFTKAAYFGRIWGDSSAPITTTQAIVNGYTDESGIVSTTKFRNGFDDSAANKDSFGNTLVNCRWMTRKSQDAPYVTNFTVNAVSSADSAVAEDGSYRLVGLVNPDLVTELNSVGFIVDKDGTEKTISLDTVYTLNGDTSKYYAVAYIDGAANSTLTVDGTGELGTDVVVGNDAASSVAVPGLE